MTELFRWNSTSWDEFSRKWNRPVYQFLLRHVYASTMRSYKLSKTSAMFITFLLSAAVHELVMAVVTQKIRSVPQLERDLHVTNDMVTGCIFSWHR